MSQGVPMIDKLRGRVNFNSWKFAMKTYLEHEDLWNCITGEDKDEKKNVKARAKIILSVETVNYVHIEETKTAKEAWDNLVKAFEDSGLTRKISLLKTLLSTKLENSNIDEYVNIIISTAHKLNGVGLKVNEEWIGCILLAGLPDEYKPMIMGLENCGMNITGDLIKTKLLQEIKNEKCGKKADNEAVFYGKTYNKNNFKNYGKNKDSRCFNCNDFGHKSFNCPKPKKFKTKQNQNYQHSNFNGFCTSAIENTNKNNNCYKWFIDSGASTHMTMNKEWLVNFHPITNNEIIVANNERLSIAGQGDVYICINGKNGLETIKVKNVMYVPNISTNLLSVSEMVKNGCKVIFEKDSCRIMKENEVLALAVLKDDMFCLNYVRIQNNLMFNNKNVYEIWHRRMGHMNINNLQLLQKCGYLKNIDFKDHADFCETCLKGKQTRLPFVKSSSQTTEILELVHSDLCGPMENESLGGSKYMFTLIDDFSRKTFVYFLESKSQVRSSFQDFKNFIERSTNKKIKILRSDNEKEYVNRDFKLYLAKEGICHQTTLQYTPQQNGLAERMNRTIIEKACMLLDAGLEKKFWAEAVNTAVYIINRSPAKGINNQIPEEVWSKKSVNLNYLKIFGCQAMSHIPKQKRQKLDSKSESCIFMGYCENSKGYRLFNMKTQKIIKSRDVVFNENILFKNNVKDGKEISEQIQFIDSFDNQNDVDISKEIENNIENNAGNEQVIEENEDENYCNNFQENAVIDDKSDLNGNAEIITSKRISKMPSKLIDYLIYSAVENKLND